MSNKAIHDKAFLGKPLENYSQKACALYLERSQSVISQEVHRINGRYDFKKGNVENFV